MPLERVPIWSSFRIAAFKWLMANPLTGEVYKSHDLYSHDLGI